MKILIAVPLCLMILMMGCSNSDSPSLTLWQERQMDDNTRIHGTPYGSSYESPNQWRSVWLPTPY